MTFDDALTALLGMLGTRVEVAIESPAGGMVAHLVGELAHGHDLSPRDDVVSAPVFFSLADDSSSGFILDPRSFARAEWSTDGELLRIEDSAGVTILVDTAGPVPGI